MAKKIGYIFVAFSVLLMLAVYFAFMKTDTFDTEKTQAVATLSAKDLILYLNADKEHYADLYVDNVIAIEGIINEINHINDRHTILLRGDNEDLSLIICDMQTDQAQKMAKLKKGDTVLLKGVFKGYLKDAVFLNCIIATNQ